MREPSSTDRAPAAYDVPGLHGCPTCKCPQPSRDRDPRFRRTPRSERWAWLLLSLVTGAGYGIGTDGTYARYRLGRKHVIRMTLESLWPARKYRRARFLLLAGPEQDCGCRLNRFNGTRMITCGEHLRLLFDGIGRKRNDA